MSDAQDIEGTYTAISMIGELVGRQAEASSIVESMQKTFDEIKANAGDGTKSIYFEVSPLQYGLWTAGSGTFMDEIANMLGLTNCFADVTGWGEISEEQVLERNPDYIVTISMYYGEGPTPEEEILSAPAGRTSRLSRTARSSICRTTSCPARPRVWPTARRLCMTLSTANNPEIPL